ncbi:uncharacterized protein LOC102807807 [Saccoglossus kowalevskii]|uniref:Uncharacterized protein LOC102807807 n=1 Tax=Saccoglossus kowalevskii TaxID=10224 RepID=A0ABM0MM34_SACKO|nr:PREDICTED: uncharacterized protein LOC102807807 [Saccoglossus kowalevskii]
MACICLIQDNEQNYNYNDLVGRPTGQPFRDSQFTPLGAGEPIGPDVVKDRMAKDYAAYFSDFDDTIAFEQPKVYDNCWLQAMLAVEWGFSPNCNEDGSYGPKQCLKKRCWCTSLAGEKLHNKGGKNNDGFYYGVDALLLRCNQN